MSRRAASAAKLAIWSLIAALVATFTPPAFSQPAPPESPQGEGFTEVFPHVRLDAEKRVVEFDGRVPILTSDPEAPVVYLEVIVCTPNTKEHETLVVTPARPSHVHAALLAIGLEPGEPGSWSWDGQEMTAHPPTGERVRVEFIYMDKKGEKRTVSPNEWVINDRTGEGLAERDWVFAGSRLVDRRGGDYYDADGAGTLIGLATFGSETLAWPTVISHESSVQEPVWIANPQRTPPIDTPVTVRLKPMD